MLVGFDMPPAPLAPAEPPMPDCPPACALPPEPAAASEPALPLAPPIESRVPAPPPALARPALPPESLPVEPLQASALLAHTATKASDRRKRAGDGACRGSQRVVLTHLHCSAARAATHADLALHCLRQLHAKNRG